MRVKRFELIAGITPDEIKEAAKNSHCRIGEGGSWITDDAAFFISHGFGRGDDEVSVEIAFPEDLSNWNDADYVLVLDEDFCQPYIPFYDTMEDEDVSFPFLDEIVSAYNELMEDLDIFQEVSD